MNTVTWKRGANPKTTVFIVEAMIGESTEWVQVGGLTATRFKHDGQTPGQTVTYRVIATRAKRESTPSQIAVLYGGVRTAPVGLKLTA